MAAAPAGRLDPAIGRDSRFIVYFYDDFLSECRFLQVVESIFVIDFGIVIAIAWIVTDGIIDRRFDIGKARRYLADTTSTHGGKAYLRLISLRMAMEGIWLFELPQRNGPAAASMNGCRFMVGLRISISATD